MTNRRRNDTRLSGEGSRYYLPPELAVAQDGRLARQNELREWAGGAGAPPPAALAAPPAPPPPVMGPPAAGRLREDPALLLADRELRMGARAMQSAPRGGRALASQRSWERHIEPILAAENPSEQAPVAGAWARRMERGEAWMVPERERDQYNAWSARREAARQRAAGRGFREGRDEADLRLREADLAERRMRNQIAARDAMWQPKIVDAGGGREALMTSPRSAVPWTEPQEPFRPSVHELDGGVRALMVGPDRAERLPDPEREWRPSLVDAGDGVRALMTSPRSAVPYRDAAAASGDVPDPVIYADPDTGVTLWRGGDDRQWRHAPRDQYADRPMDAKMRAHFTFQAESAARRLREIEAENPWFESGREDRDLRAEKKREELRAAQAALSGGGSRPAREADGRAAAPGPAPRRGGEADGSAPRTVRMRAPDGEVREVRAENAEYYESREAVRLEGDKDREDVEALIRDLREGGER